MDLPRAWPVWVARAAVALALAPLGPAREARAQTASEIATAKRWFSEGRALEDKGDFAAALDLFRRAVQVKKTPQIVYHVGLCESRTGALVEALVDLDSAASLARAAHADDVVAASQADLVDVKARIPSLEVRVPEGARARRFVVDGSAIALSMLRTPMPLDPGEHSVTIEFESGASDTKKSTLAEHDARVLELAPPALPSAPPPSPLPPIPAPDAAPAPRASTTVPWILVGGGGAALAAGVVLFVEARAKEGSLHDACPARVACDPALKGSYDTATAFNTAGITLGAVGLAAAGIGVSMLVLRPSAGTSAALVVLPGGLGVTGRF